jgi:hypothetical protein
MKTYKQLLDGLVNIHDDLYRMIFALVLMNLVDTLKDSDKDKLEYAQTFFNN